MPFNGSKDCCSFFVNSFGSVIFLLWLHPSYTMQMTYEGSWKPPKLKSIEECFFFLICGVDHWEINSEISVLSLIDNWLESQKRKTTMCRQRNLHPRPPNFESGALAAWLWRCLYNLPLSRVSIQHTTLPWECSPVSPSSTASEVPTLSCITVGAT